MAAKKKAPKKPARKQTPAQPLSKDGVIDSTQTLKSPAAAEAAAPKRRGRPPGSANKKSAAKKSAGRPAATKFLYSLSKAAADDGLGLEDAPKKVEVIGPFNSEDEAINDALATIGTEAGVEVTLYRDYRKGTPEIRTRLI